LGVIIRGLRDSDKVEMSTEEEKVRPRINPEQWPLPSSTLPGGGPLGGGADEQHHLDHTLASPSSAESSSPQAAGANQAVAHEPLDSKVIEEMKRQDLKSEEEDEQSQKVATSSSQPPSSYHTGNSQRVESQGSDSQEDSVEETSTNSTEVANPPIATAIPAKTGEEPEEEWREVKTKRHKKNYRPGTGSQSVSGSENSGHGSNKGTAELDFQFDEVGSAL
jgi:hypothetical protein